MAVALLMSSIVLVGLAVVMLEFKNQMDRDLQMQEIYTYAEMSLRLAEKYIKNAQLFQENGSNSFTVNTSLTEQNLNVDNVLHSNATSGVMLNTQLMDPLFPPKKLRPGEKLEVLSYRGSFFQPLGGDYYPTGFHNSMINLNMLIRYTHETEQGTYRIDKEFTRRFFAPNIVLYKRSLGRQIMPE